MLKNVGTADRIVRLFIAALLAFVIVMGFTEGLLSILLGVAAAYLAFSGIVGHCLVYKPLDIDTHAHGGTYHSGEDTFDGRAGG